MIEFNYSNQGEDLLITLKTDLNKIGTFHKLVSVIYKFDWDIVSGDIQTIHENGTVFVYDILKLRPDSGNNPRVMAELGMLMETVFSSDDSILEEIYKEIFSKRPRIKSYFHEEAELLFEDDPEKNWTEMYIEADSGKGLLFYLTKILRDNKVDIVSATIETDPNIQKACDTFYLRDENGFPFAATDLSTIIRESIQKNL